MEQIQTLVTLSQKQLANIIYQVTPLCDQAKEVVLKASESLLPYYNHVHEIAAENYLVVQPFIQQGLKTLEPLGTYLAYGQELLPEFKGYPVNYIGIAVILIHVLNYNFIAQLEYKTKVFTKLFGKAAIYVNIIILLLSALIRDHYLIKAIQMDSGSRVLFEPETAASISVWMITFGIFLNLWVLSTLGLKNMFNGDSFGYTLSAPIVGGPFYFFDDPQYFGTTLCLLGYAVKHQSRIGYGLTGVMYLVFSFSVLVLEAPHMKSIYDNLEKKKPKKEKLKAKKDN